MTWQPLESPTHFNGSSLPNVIGILLDQNKSLGRIEGSLGALDQRVTRIESRVDQPRVHPKDFLSYLPGLLALALAAAGRLGWIEALRIASGH